MAINSACHELGLPWVMGACVRMEGQLMTFLSGGQGAPCYRCVYGRARTLVEDCDGAGVFAPIAGIVGAAMAHQALMLVTGQPVESQLSLLDGRRWEWRRVAISPDPDCSTCGTPR
jgi:adenylyltransferase/sulfurtransferase